MSSFLMLFIFSSQQVLESSKSESESRFFELQTGASFGQETTICGGVEEYYAMGADLSYHFKKDRYNDLIVGSGLYYMNYGDNSALGVSPYIKYDSRLFGISGGINYGDFYTNNRSEKLLPQASLRFGNLENFFVDGHYSTFFPGGMPVIQLGIGFGLNSNYTSDHIEYIRVGISDNGFYVNPKFHIGQKTLLNPYLAFGGDSNFQISMALHFMLQ